MKKASSDTVLKNVQRAFDSELGEQIDILFTTSDGRVFIRLEEATSHANGLLDPMTSPLIDKAICEWGNRYGDEPTLISSNIYPQAQRDYEAIDTAIHLIVKAYPQLVTEHISAGHALLQDLAVIKQRFEEQATPENKLLQECLLQIFS